MADESLPFPSPSVLLGEDIAGSDLPAKTDSNSTATAAAAAPSANSKKDRAHARRPSNERKKAAGQPPRKAPTIEIKDASVVKPKQTKSRNGCHTCKTKRLKCGEEKPGCQNCAKRNVPCGGYKKVFQWRDFNDQNVKSTVERPQPKQATSHGSVTRHKSAGSSLVGTPVSEFPPTIFGAPSLVTDVTKATSPHQGSLSKDQRPQLDRTRSDSPRNPTGLSPQDSALTTPPQDEIQEPLFSPHDEHRPNMNDEFASVSFSPEHMFTYRSRSLSPSLSGHNSTFTQFLMSQNSMSNGGPSDFVTFSMPDDLQIPAWSGMGDSHGMHGAEFIDDELLSTERVEDGIFVWPSHFNTPDQSKGQSPFDDAWAQYNDETMSRIYAQPDVPVPSHEHLALQFQQVTAANMSIMDGPNENPWRTIIWPMAQSSAALYNAILAMTAFNMTRDNPRFRVIGQEHKQLSIQNINAGIRDGTMNDLTALATALTLGFSEAWDQPTTTGNVHIKGAQVLVKRALEEHRVRPVMGDDLKRLKFLCNAWVYMDVISRLTAVDSDEGTFFDSTQIFEPDSPRLASLSRMGSGSRRGFGIDFGMPIDARLDPLMGCAGTLFPIIGRVANLVRKVCRSNHNSPGVVSHGRDLKRMLEDWDPPEEVESPEDPTTGVENARQTAEAYRWATLLHLHQAVPELPSLSSEEIAQRAMAAVATVPLESRTTVVQIYPLMVAGCEQKAEEDRQWVRERWHAMNERLRIGILDKCLAVTEEVWRRRDAYETKPLAQRKLVRTAELQEARKNSSPRHRRRPTDMNGAEPGRSGMIFSYVETDTEPIAHQLKDVNGPDTIRRRRDAADRVTVDPAYTVRGPIHWIGVMWSWSWEVLLG